jgi:UDP-N-acetyl-2-amino-2-deoxyglucuronate dehydrogenase
VEPLRIGIVGAGAIGKHNAQEASRSGAAKVAGVFDTNPKISSQLAGSLGARSHETYASLLEDPTVEAVLLSVPHHLHCDMTIAAARSGKHVLVEKPLANTMAEADEMVQSCRQGGVALGVNFSFRYLARIQEAKRLVDAGALGEIAGVQVASYSFRERGYWMGARSGSPDDWRGSKEKAGAGFLFMNLCHVIDYVYYLSGLKASRVYAEYATRASPVDVEDTVSLCCRFDNGAIGSFSGSSVQRGPSVGEERVWGSRGTLVMRGEGLSFWSTRPIDGKRPGTLHRRSRFSPVRWTAEWVEDFARAVREGREPTISGRAGWENLAFITAALRSMEEQRPVSVPEYPRGA